MITVIRNLIGKLILFADKTNPPKTMQRNPEQQAAIDEKTQTLSIYEFKACPFCVKVRRELKRQGLNIELRDAKSNPHKQTLIKEGGKHQVPCLRIDHGKSVQWMYESDDIIQYLRNNFT